MTSEPIDRPYGGLPEGERVGFINAKIEAVIVEIRYLGAENKDLSASASKLLNSFSDFGLSQIDSSEQHNLNVNVGEGGKTDSEIQITDRGWQISNPDKSVVFTLMSSMASLQVRSYERWSSSIHPKLETLLLAVVENVAPGLSQRIGLRYVNRLIGKEGEFADQWVGRVDPNFLGPINHPVLGKKIREDHQALRFYLEPGIAAVLRQGPLIDSDAGLGSYIVDIDVSNENAFTFDPAEILESAQRLNRTALSIFKLVLTEAEINRMQPTVLEVSESKEGK